MWTAKVCILVICFTIAAWSETYTLFNDKVEYPWLRQVDQYDHILENLNASDRLVMSDGAEFEFLEKLGHGETTQVLKVKALNGNKLGEVMALRLPLKKGSLASMMGGTPYVNFITDTLSSATTLEKSGIGPRFYSSKNSEYASLEFVDIKFRLDQYMNSYSDIPPRLRAKVNQSLKELFTKLAGVMSISDFKADNIVFDGEKWLLLDWYNVTFLEENNSSVEKKVYPIDFSKPALVQQLFSFYKQDEKQARGEHLRFGNLHPLILSLYETTMDERYRILDSGINPITGNRLIINTDYGHNKTAIDAELESRRRSGKLQRVRYSGTISQDDVRRIQKTIVRTACVFYYSRR